ncbi:hypothetical protein GZ77_06120 [Endozoicomonas montiporae]|uniref:Uncharacterized protein n=2 Tax=Endozoicomonas montiporae TaxID=1027273 RepID=A0A081NC65_9GAMM|nr:hypothetical protein [Endozoicomonas montiporae]AMO56368.1 WD repeat-containing protein [Endozoicomonas montiporae CL-33]KEQ16038.1 hypothetical protein GZ77_06120 [Endozoicomonas montiporae]
MSSIEKNWAIAGLVIPLVASCLQAQAQTAPNAQQPTETTILLEYVIPIDPNRLPETVTSTPMPTGSSVLTQSTPTPIPTTGSSSPKRHCKPYIPFSISWGRKNREDILAVGIGSGGLKGCPYSGAVQIFTVGAGRESKLQYAEHSGNWVPSVDFNNGQLAFGGDDKQVRVLDDGSFAHLKTLNATMPIKSVVYNREGTLLAVGADDRAHTEVMVYNVTDSFSRLYRLIDNRVSGVNDLEFNKYSTELAVATGDTDVWIYNATTSDLLQDLSAATGIIYDMDYSDDGNYLATVGVDQTLRVYKVESDSSFFTLTHALSVGNGLTSVVFSPGSIWLVVGLSDGTVRFYNPKDLSISPQIISYKKAYLYDLGFNPDGTKLAVARKDGVSIYRIVSKDTEVHNDSTSTTPLVALFMAVLGGGMLLP